MHVLINVLCAIRFPAFELPALVAATGSAVTKRAANRRISYLLRPHGVLCPASPQPAGARVYS
jgi:hypothetical protein